MARILVVDDAPLECRTLDRIAASLGHAVVGEAADLAAAVALAEALQPELIVVDGRLPGGGLEAIEALRRAAAGALIFVIAALGELDLVRAARARGAQGALRRPLLASQVAFALSEVARSQSPEGPGAPPED